MTSEDIDNKYKAIESDVMASLDETAKTYETKSEPEDKVIEAFTAVSGAYKNIDEPADENGQSANQGQDNTEPAAAEQETKAEEQAPTPEPEPEKTSWFKAMREKKEAKAEAKAEQEESFQKRIKSLKKQTEHQNAALCKRLALLEKQAKASEKNASEHMDASFGKAIGTMNANNASMNTQFQSLEKDLKSNTSSVLEQLSAIEKLASELSKDSPKQSEVIVSQISELIKNIEDYLIKSQSLSEAAFKNIADELASAKNEHARLESQLKYAIDKNDTSFSLIDATEKARHEILSEALSKESKDIRELIETFDGCIEEDMKKMDEKLQSVNAKCDEMLEFTSIMTKFAYIMLSEKRRQDIQTGVPEDSDEFKEQGNVRDVLGAILRNDKECLKAEKRFKYARLSESGLLRNIYICAGLAGAAIAFIMIIS